MTTKKDKCTKIIKYFINFFLLFFYQGCQVTYKIINPYYKGLKKNISQYILSQTVF